MSKSSFCCGFTLFILVSLCAAGLDAASSEFNIAKSRQAPVVDGIINDKCWNKSTELQKFHVFKPNQEGEKADTTVFATTDGNWIYFAFSCPNKNMRFLNQAGTEHDNLGILGDESVEVFLTRKELPVYYHFGVNFANVKTDRKVTNSGGKNLAWSIPWVSATNKTEDGWTAEIAIPLYILNKSGKNDILLNLIRNKINVNLDAMGAKMSEAKQYHLWSPIERTAHDPATFGTLKGLASVKVRKVFLPYIESVKVENLDIAGDAITLNMIANLRGATSKPGNAVLEIFEKKNGKEKNVFRKKFPLPPRANKTFKIKVPVSGLSAQHLFMAVSDAKTGMKIQECAVKFDAVLLKKAIPEFSFYTTEKNVRIKAVSSLSSGALKNISYRLLDGSGKSVTAPVQAQMETILTFPANRLKLGKNNFKLQLQRKDGKVLGAKDVSVNRLPVKKTGSETKVDHFRRVVVKDGKPFFPFGMYLGGAKYYMPVKEFREYVFKMIAKSGMNTVIGGLTAYEGDIKLAELLAEYSKRYNLQLGFWGKLLQTKGIGKKFKDLEDQKAYAKKVYYQQLLPHIKTCTRLMENLPNLLFYYSLDEPNLRNWRVNMTVLKFYHDTMRELDPYHVLFGLYARSIPPVPAAIDYVDVLGYDIYTYSDWEGSFARICDNMAVQIAQLDKICAKKDMPTWAVPMTNSLDPFRAPRFLTYQEQMCQSYTAMIYGAKGLLYFSQVVANGRQIWNAFEDLSRHLKVIQPALLNYPVKQEIIYKPGVFNAEKWKCPDAHAGIFKFPEGGYLMLAVNGKNYPVDVTYKIGGLKAAERLFAKAGNVKLKDNAFSEKLEPYAVRAYRIELGKVSKKTVKVNVAMKAYPGLEKKIPSNEQRRKQAASRKNHVINPSMEILSKGYNVPEFYTPFRLIEIDTAGEKDSRWRLDDNNPRFGKYSLRMHRYPGDGRKKSWRAGTFGTFSLPSSIKKKDYTFSFYAKSGKDGDELWVGVDTTLPSHWDCKTFKLTKNWKRYGYNLKIGGPNFHGGKFLIQPNTPGATVWIDGIQLESGNEATKFSE